MISRKNLIESYIIDNSLTQEGFDVTHKAIRHRNEGWKIVKKEITIEYIRETDNIELELDLDIPVEPEMPVAVVPEIENYTPPTE